MGVRHWVLKVTTGAAAFALAFLAAGVVSPFWCRTACAEEVPQNVTASADVPPLKVTLVPYPVEGALEVESDATGLVQAGRNPACFRISLVRDGHALCSAVHRLAKGEGRATVSLPIRDLAPGNYAVSVVAEDDAQLVLARATLPFEMPVRPYWLGSAEGLSPDLPAGWLPVEAQGSVVRVWGREYRFDNGLFMTAATAKGASLLAGAPIEARLRWRGGEAAVSGPPASVGELSSARVGLAASGEAGPFRLEGTITVEFDGMVRTDFTLSGPPDVPLEELIVRIPLEAEHAKYLYHYPGRWGTAYNAGALPPEGWTHSFKPLVWLGDEERGFCWFTESDRNWAPLDNEEAIQIKREGERVVLQLNVIKSPQLLASPLQYTFGFQATPVKEVTEDVWDFRICHHGSYGIESQPFRVSSPITYPAEGNISLDQGTIEMWVVPMFDPDVVVPEGAGRGDFNQDLFTLALPNDGVVGFYCNIDDRGMRFYLKDGPDYPLVVGARSRWQMGERHHVAVTWGDAVRIYGDGELLATADYKGTIARDLSKAEMRLGAAPSRFIVDSIRISDIPRTTFNLSGPPMLDEHTLLLDNFDTEASDSAEQPLPPEKCAGQRRVSVGGSPFVPAKFGAGVRLYPEGDEQLTVLDRLAQLGVRTLCFHEHWADIQNYPLPSRPESLRRLVQACHERGIRLLLYFGYLMSDLAPEYPLYSNECLVRPRGGDYTRQPQQTAYMVCYASHWQDFIVQGIARMMDEYGIDGVYLDGTSEPWACTNTRHGCGYQAPDGSIRPTYSFFATRRIMKRIYNVVKARKPNGLVNVHQSTAMTPPTLSFATSYWDGEQFGSIERGAEVFELLPLDAFRTEFMGRQWGVPAEFLCYNRPYTYSEAMSFTLLHDVLVRGNLGGSLEMESALWREMEDFGRRQAEWLPYWSNSNVVQVEPSTCKASLYNRGPLGVVLIVSNLGEAAAQAIVTLDAGALGLPQVAALDILTRERLDWDGKTLGVALQPLSFAAVRLVP